MDFIQLGSVTTNRTNGLTGEKLAVGTDGLTVRKYRAQSNVFRHGTYGRVTRENSKTGLLYKRIGGYSQWPQLCWSDHWIGKGLGAEQAMLPRWVIWRRLPRVIITYHVRINIRIRIHMGELVGMCVVVVYTMSKPRKTISSAMYQPYPPRTGQITNVRPLFSWISEYNWIRTCPKR